MITIADVAREAQVSAATVSRVINNKVRVMPETSRRVEAAIKRLGYEPNMLARNFRKNESRVLLILAPNIINPFYSGILTGIGVAARRLRYSFLICTTGGEREHEKSFLDMLECKRADGAILLATAMEREEIERYAFRYPIVQCSEYYPGTSVAHVSVDHYSAAKRAVEYLLSLKHRRIAMISSINGYPSTRMRMKGYKDALADAGIAFDEEIVRYGGFDYNYQSSMAAAQSLLSMPARPTAIFCISDMLALGAIAGVQDMGLRVAEDVSVVGFDDVDYATMFRPHITTVALPCYRMGECAVELLYKLLLGEEAPQREVMLGSELKVRASSSALCI